MIFPRIALRSSILGAATSTPVDLILRVASPLVLAVLLFVSVPGVAIAESRLSVEESPLSVKIGGRDYSLPALIVKPRGVAHRLPIAIIAHGSPRANADRANYRVRALLPLARNLAHRGWLVVAFLRRGFGENPGTFVEGFACSAPDYHRALATAAEDIEAVRAAVATRPDADATRVLGLGVSVGGAALLAWAATRPDGLVGVVNLSGGSGALIPGRNGDEKTLVAAFASYGARARIPTLWLYAENDSFFGPAGPAAAP